MAANIKYFFDDQKCEIIISKCSDGTFILGTKFKIEDKKYIDTFKIDLQDISQIKLKAENALNGTKYDFHDTKSGVVFDFHKDKDWEMAFMEFPFHDSTGRYTGFHLKFCFYGNTLTGFVSFLEKVLEL